MKLATFTSRDNERPRIGLVGDDQTRLLDVVTAMKGRQPLPFDPYDMLSLINAGPTALQALRALAQDAAGGLALAECHLLAPIPRPRKNIFCVGWNYQLHFEEGAAIRPQVADMPTHPTFFTKTPTSVLGPYDDVPFHRHVSLQLDWEAELGLVLGRGGVDITESDALSHVFGYLVVNDLSWRDVQRRHGQQWFKGKSLDGTCPMGPWITTADAVNPDELDIRCSVDGITKQNSNTRQLYFKLPRIIAELSAGMTLEFGDIISTGTPAGVGHARTPPEFMVPGNVVATEIQSLGVLRNRIIE